MYWNVFTRATVFAWALPAVFVCTAMAGEAECKKPKDIVDTAVAADDFNTLVTAVKAAELVDVLKSEGPFTVFAPTDEAFSEIPKKQLDALLKDKKALAEVLTYHVVAGKVMAEDVVNTDAIETVLGKAVKITVKDGKVAINDAQVIKADIECSNGVIHVLDGVLLPPAE